MVEKTGLEVELTVPGHIVLPDDAKTVEFDVLATLRNHDEHDRVVHVPNSDDVHFWQLLDARHREIVRSPLSRRTKALENARCETITAGHAFAEPQTVSVDAGKLKCGGCYTLRYVLWDEHPAEARIRVCEAPTPGEAVKPKASKRATGKRAAGKRKTRKSK